jgi:hypothetical protein
MKLLFTTIIISLSILFIPKVSFAQQCFEVNASNYSSCCTGPDAPLNKNLCDNYNPQNQTGGTYSQEPGFIGPVQGTLNSGSSPANNPLNGAVNTNSIAPTPQASSNALKACSAIRFDSLLDILIWLKCIIGSAIIPLMFTVAFLYFLYNMLMFIKGSDNTAKKEEYKKSVYVGIIALVVMTSVWGIVNVVSSTFGFGNTVPELQTDYLKKN